MEFNILNQWNSIYGPRLLFVLPDCNRRQNMSERSLLRSLQQHTSQRETLQHYRWSKGNQMLLQNDTFVIVSLFHWRQAQWYAFLRNLTDDTVSVSKELGYLVFREYQWPEGGGDWSYEEFVPLCQLLHFDRLIYTSFDLPVP